MGKQYKCKCGNRIHKVTALHGTKKCRWCARNKGEKSPLWICKQLDKIKLEYLYIKKDLSCLNIAKKFNVCAELVRKRLHLFNIKIKPNRGARKGKRHWAFKGRYKVKCEWCQKIIFVPDYEYHHYKYHYCSKAHSGKGFSKHYSGPNSKLFLKKHSSKHPKQFNNELKRQVRKRDKDICQVCHKHGQHVHHIDYNKCNISLNNLITLCHKCHTKTNHNRIVWKNYFQNKSYQLRKGPLIIGVAGCFDLFHSGHLNIIKKASQLGDYLIVLVSTNKLIYSYKKIYPILTLTERITVMKAIKYVDKVVSQTKLIDIEQIKSLKIDLYVLGSDWEKRTDNEGLNWLRAQKKVVFVPYTERLSSSKIKEQIISNAIPIIRAQTKRQK